MKLLTQIILIVTVSALGRGDVFAQPDWVKDAMQRSSTLAVSPDANAIILHKTNDVTVRSNGHTEARNRFAAQILRHSGKSYGTHVVIESPYHTVKHLKGWAILPDGKVRKLSKKQIEKRNTTDSAIRFDDWYRIVATLPDAGPGVVVAFSYDVETREEIGLYRQFSFQRQDPVLLSRLTVKIPDGWVLRKSEHQTDEVSYTVADNRHTWTALNLPYRREEPLMPDWSLVSPRVALTCYADAGKRGGRYMNWAYTAKWGADILQPPAIVDETIRAKTLEIVQGRTTVEGQIEAVALFVRDAIRYMAIEIGQGAWEPYPASETLYNLYGDCKDKATLMRAMLRVIDIPSLPVLALSEDAGPGVDTGLPSPYQFNHCIVGIPLDSLSTGINMPQATSGRWLFFDPTHPTTNLGELPESLQGSSVLVASYDASGLLTLPETTPAIEQRVYRARATVTPQGMVVAQVRMVEWGNGAIKSRFLRQMVSYPEQIETWQMMFAQRFNHPVISNYQVGAEGDSTWVTFRLTGEYSTLQTRPLALLQPDIFQFERPEALTGDIRQHPIWLGSPVRVDTEVIWELPAGWTSVEDTPPASYSCTAAGLNQQISVSGSMVHLKASYRREGRLMEATSYPSVRAFVRDVRDTMSRTLLLRPSD